MRWHLLLSCLKPFKTHELAFYHIYNENFYKRTFSKPHYNILFRVYYYRPD